MNRSDATIKKHKRYTKRLLDFYKKHPREMTEMDLAKYLDKQEDMTNSTRKNIVSAFRVFFRDFMEMDIAERIEMPSIGPTPTFVPSREQLRKFYKSLDMKKYRALFLCYASSGLRNSELAELKMGDVDFERRMFIPGHEEGTKRTWVSSFNKEAERALQEFLPEREENDSRVFQVKKTTISSQFQKYSERSGVKITPQLLRRWFASEITSQGVDSSYVDAFCGRTPRSVLERDYLDFSPERLKEVYEKVGLKVLE